MFEQITAGLILAAIGGATYVAYHHPKAWKGVSPFVWGLQMMAQIGLNAWNFGVGKSALAIGREIKDVQLALDASESLMVSSLLIFGLMGIMAFLLVLDLWVSGLKESAQ